MRKGYLLGIYGSFLGIIILFFDACNSNQSAAVSADTVAAITDTQMKAVPAPLAHISGFLNILYIDTATFMKLKDSARGKITFRFFVKAPDSLTLSGWSNDSANQRYPGQPPKPDITLWVGGNSAFEIGSGQYFGNLVLYNRNIRSILKSIRTNKATYVLFVPMDPATTNGQITYEVHAVSTDPQTLKWSDVAGFAPTGDQTNPSPPRGAFN